MSSTLPVARPVDAAAVREPARRPLRGWDLLPAGAGAAVAMTRHLVLPAWSPLDTGIAAVGVGAAVGLGGWAGARARQRRSAAR
jgi:hypothetical protein